MYSTNHVNNELDLIVPVKNYPPLYWFVIIATILTLVAMIINIIVMISNSYFDITSIFGHFIFCSASTFYVFWVLSGKEKVVFKKDSIDVIKSCRLFTLRKNYKKNCISNITVKSIPNENKLEEKRRILGEMIQAFPLWRKMGRIEFDYNGKYICILNGLDKNEIQEVVEIFKTEVTKE